MSTSSSAGRSNSEMKESEMKRKLRDSENETV